MPIELKMPALSPTMEEGTLAKWLVKEGDMVQSGDLIAEIETDKATMEFEAVDEGVIAKILVAEGTDGVKVGTVIAMIAGEDEDASEVASAAPADSENNGAAAKTAAGDAGGSAKNEAKADAKEETPAAKTGAAAPAASLSENGERIKASPLARRIAADQGLDLTSIKGTGPNGRIVKADLEGASKSTPAAANATASPASEGGAAAASAPAAAKPFETDIPHSTEKLSNMRKTIARRLTEAKQTIPHIYLTVDIQLDALLKLRGNLNKALEPQGVKLSVNDLLIKALAKALVQVPSCNVTFAGDQLIRYERADISVAVSIPGGLITPIVTDAGNKSISTIANEMKDLAARAKDGKLQPQEYQGGTASLSNMGMFGISQFDAVINPPQAMIMAIGAGQQRPWIVDGAVSIATVMSATGSFDHRAIDGADGAQLMQAFKNIIENPLALVA